MNPPNPDPYLGDCSTRVLQSTASHVDPETLAQSLSTMTRMRIGLGNTHPMIRVCRARVRPASIFSGAKVARLPVSENFLQRRKDLGP